MAGKSFSLFFGVLRYAQWRWRIATFLLVCLRQTLVNIYIYIFIYLFILYIPMSRLVGLNLNW